VLLPLTPLTGRILLTLVEYPKKDCNLRCTGVVSDR
jgi:hypothetical protein